MIAALNFQGEKVMSINLILVVVLLIILIGVLPQWPHSKSWGYRPTGGIGMLLLIVIILILMGYI
jgi:hypothetical protein